MKVVGSIDFSRLNGYSDLIYIRLEDYCTRGELQVSHIRYKSTECTHVHKALTSKPLSIIEALHTSKS